MKNEYLIAMVAISGATLPIIIDDKPDYSLISETLLKITEFCEDNDLLNADCDESVKLIKALERTAETLLSEVITNE